MNDQLRIAREVHRAQNRGIGEPLIILPSDAVFVHEDGNGEKRISIRADKFIEVAEAFAEPPVSPT